MDKVKKAIKTDNLKKKIYKNDRKNTVGAIVRDDGNDDGNNALFEKIQKLKDTAIRTRDQKKQQNKSSDLLKKIQSLKRRARRRHSFRLRGIAEYLLGKRKRNLMREDFIQKLETLDSRYEIISQEDAKELLRQNVEKTKHSMSAVVRIYKSILDMEKQDQHISRLETLLSRYKQISTDDTESLLDIDGTKTDDTESLLDIDGTKTDDLVTLVKKIYDKIPKNTTFCLDFDGCSDVQHMLGEEFDEEYAFKYEKNCKPIIRHALFGTRSAPQGNVGKRGQWLRDNTPALKEIHQTIQTSKPEDTITIITGSNRQSEEADKGIAKGKNGIRCDQTLRMITEVMAKNGVKAKFSPSLLSDFDGNERFTEGCLVDDSKVLILIKQMHEVASKNPDKKIHEEFIFLDDRIDILKGLKEVFSKHPEYIPKGIKTTSCRHWLLDGR